MAISPLHAPITTAASYVGSLYLDTYLYHHPWFQQAVEILHGDTHRDALGYFDEVG
jgi:hypothetical protein